MAANDLMMNERRRRIEYCLQKNRQTGWERRPEEAGAERERQRQREQMRLEQQMQRNKKRCMVLGVTAMVLSTILAWKGVQQQVREAGGANSRILMLVNKEHEVPSGYEPRLHWLQNGSCAVAEEMYDALRDMLTEGSREGREFVVASGYRSREFQQELLEEDIQASMDQEGLTWQEAYEKETRETMPPGCSEHETGLAADIVALNYQVLDGGQEMTVENQWLQENCSRYGFILRYPRGKEEITGVNYEPWHFRYVGKKAAAEITKREITLEEYLEA